MDIGHGVLEGDFGVEDGVGAANSNPLSDLRVRQAIAYAIDMDTIAEQISKLSEERKAIAAQLADVTRLHTQIHKTN